MYSRLRRPAAALLTTALAASVLGIVPAAYAADGLSGKVTVPGGAGYGDAAVDLYELDNGRWDWIDDTTTAPDGTYSFAVPAGEYRVGFEDFEDVYAAEFYNNADIVEDASTVTAPDAAVNVELAPAAHLTGMVLDENGDPLSGISVEAYRAVEVDGETQYRSAGGDSTGDVLNPGIYDIGGLPGGDYLIEFEENAAPGDHTYAVEWYDNAPNRYVADSVTVADGATLAVPVDAQLELDSQISGVVYDTVIGTPAAAGSVTIYTQVGDEYPEVEEADIEPADSGAYVIDGLAAGTYYVRFRADVVGGDAQEFWDDKNNVLTATPIGLLADDAENDVSPVLVLGENEPPYLQSVTDPTISGTPQVGSPLTASPGTWNPSPTTIRYTWYAGEDERQDSASNVYVPVAADLGMEIFVDVYVSRTGYGSSRGSAVASGAVIPAPVPPVVTPPAVTPPVVTPPVVTPPAPVVDLPTALAKALAAVTVTGKPKVGKTLKVANLDLDVRTAVTYKFQWFAGTTKIKKATKSKLKVVKAMKGKKLSVKVTGKVGATSKSRKIKVGKVR